VGLTEAGSVELLDEIVVGPIEATAVPVKSPEEATVAWQRSGSGTVGRCVGELAEDGSVPSNAGSRSAEAA